MSDQPRLRSQAMLRIYVARHCAGCATATALVERVRAARPGVPVHVVDIDVEINIPRHVIGTPMYFWNDRVLFLGNPSEAELLAEVDRHRGWGEVEHEG